ncbi:MAG: hypothetical protein K9I48_04160 [Sphingobacteriales bacterium]|nr:hypothetical protein [Sphingobacteriales bacterium]
MNIEKIIVGNRKNITKIYGDFVVKSKSEQALLSDLSQSMYDDIIVQFNKNESEKASQITLALAAWICTDINYFLSMETKKRSMYIQDLVSSLQVLGHLINICEDFKNWTLAHSIQREYSKLYIRFALYEAIEI